MSLFWKKVFDWLLINVGPKAWDRFKALVEGLYKQYVGGKK